MRGTGGMAGTGRKGASEGAIGHSRHGVFEHGEKRFRSGAVIEGKAVPARKIQPAPTGGDTGAFRPGQRVSHKKFGLGFIEGVDGDKLQVVFDKAGRKKVIDRFVDLV